MGRAAGSSVRIVKTRTGVSVRATGSVAQVLFDAMCKAQPSKPVSPPAATTEPTKENNRG